MIKINTWALERVSNNLKSWRRDLMTDYTSIQEDIAEGCALASDPEELEILQGELVLIKAFFSVLEGIKKEGGIND